MHDEFEVLSPDGIDLVDDEHDGVVHLETPEEDVAIAASTNGKAEKKPKRIVLKADWKRIDNNITLAEWGKAERGDTLETLRIAAWCLWNEQTSAYYPFDDAYEIICNLKRKHGAALSKQLMETLQNSAIPKD